MKNYKLALATSIVAIGLTGCNSTTEFVQRDTNEAPTWYVEYEPRDDGRIYTTAVASSNDTQLARDKAVMHAKAQLADQVKGMVSSLLNRVVGENNGEVTQDVTNQIMKNIVAKENVAGYTIDKTDISVIEGTDRKQVYVMISYPEEQVQKMIKRHAVDTQGNSDVIKALIKELENEEAKVSKGQ